MIVLDEHLEPDLIDNIRHWYGGRVIFVSELRCDTVIKDDTIPQILAKEAKKPTFVTINTKDFWRKIKINNKLTVVCFKVEDLEMKYIPNLLKLLFRTTEFSTKGKRVGYMFRIDKHGNAQYYHHQKISEIHKLNLTRIPR